MHYMDEVGTYTYTQPSMGDWLVRRSNTGESERGRDKKDFFPSFRLSCMERKGEGEVWELESKCGGEAKF